MAKKIKTKTDDIRKLSDADLQKEIDQSYRGMFALSLKRETLQLQNHREIPRMRRNVARLKTIQRQRAIVAQANVGGSE